MNIKPMKYLSPNQIVSEPFEREKCIGLIKLMKDFQCQTSLIFCFFHY